MRPGFDTDSCRKVPGTFGLCGDVEVAEGFGEGGFLVGGVFAFADDEGARDAEGSGGEFFWKMAGDDDGVFWNAAFGDHGSGAGDINDFC